MRSSFGSGFGIGISDKVGLRRKRVIKASIMVDRGVRSSPIALPSC